MSQLKKLLAIQSDKIPQQGLREAVEALASDYSAESDKEAFEKEAAENITLLLEMVEKHAPNVLKPEETVSSEEPSPKNKPIKQAKPELGDEEISACRQVIKEFNKRKREAEGDKPTKSRMTKMKERLLSVATLIPDKLEKDEAVLETTEKILLDTAYKLCKTWGMARIKPVQEAIEEKFDHLKSKAEA